MIQFRPYQADCITAFYQYYATGGGGHGLIVVPTAGGKSLIIGGLATQICQRWPGQRILVLSHVQELIAQNHAKIGLCWREADAGIYAASLKRRQYLNDIITASIQSVYTRAAELGHRDLVFIDECHLIQFGDTGMYHRLLKELRVINPNLKICGFTATDYRLDGGMLTEGDGALFDDIIIEIPIQHLLDEGYITAPRGKQQEIQVNLKGVSLTSKGDYSEKQMGKRFDDAEFIKAALDSDMQYLQDRRSIAVFNATIDNAHHVAESMFIRGIPCEVVDGDMHKYDREDKFERFRSGELRALASVGVMTTGTDIPNIDCEILFIATKSPGKLKQILGRGLRVLYADGYDLTAREGRLEGIAHGPKPDFLVLDHGGNIERHGPLTAIEKPQKKKKGEKSETAPMKARICKVCRDGWPLDARICTTCGTPLVIERSATKSLSIEASNADILGTPFLRGEAAQWFIVNDIKYSSHVSLKGYDCLKVTYHCGSMQFDEYIRPELLAGRKWWYARAEPEAMQKISHLFDTSENNAKISNLLPHAKLLDKPRRVQIAKRDKFYEVIRHDFQPAPEEQPDSGIRAGIDSGAQYADR